MPALFNAKIYTDLINFDEDFDLFPQFQDKSPLQFFWSDFDQCCEHFRNKLKSDAQFAQMRDQKLDQIEHLKNIPVWIKKDAKLFTTNLFDIYQGHLEQKRFLDTDVTLPVDISFISPSGPFKKIAITDCLNIQHYQDFVFLSLLDNKLPFREFRLRLSSRILFESGKQFEHTFLGDLCQLTMKGLLFKVKSQDFFNKVKESQQIRLLLNTHIFDSTSHCSSWQEVQAMSASWPQHPLYTQNKTEAFQVNPTQLQLAHRFDYGRTNEVYFFVSFEHLQSSNSLMVKRIEKFLEHMKSCIQYSMKAKSA